MPKAKKTSRMSRAAAQSLSDLVAAAGEYFRHADAEAVLGYQVCGHAVIDLQEIHGYLEYHELSEEAEGLTRHDRQLISKTLSQSASLLDKLAVIPFALPATAVAKRLREASAKIMRW